MMNWPTPKGMPMAHGDRTLPFAVPAMRKRRTTPVASGAAAMVAFGLAASKPVVTWGILLGLFLGFATDFILVAAGV